MIFSPVMEKHRIYFGKKFLPRKDGYWGHKYYENKRLKEVLAHRWVWQNHHGEDPKGSDIHHKDGNRENNDINNLEKLSRSDHLKEHWKNPKDLKKRIKQLEKVRPIKWLKSEEGRKAVSEKGKQIWKDRKPHVITCEHCGNKKEFKRWARFCSKKCYMSWRWINVLKNVPLHK